MSVSKKIADLPKKSVSTKKADAVKGGAKQRLGQSSLTSNMRVQRKAGN